MAGLRWPMWMGSKSPECHPMVVSSVILLPSLNKVIDMDRQLHVPPG